jgi:uncharacterized phiE125 gp8 family phage protein
MHRTVTPPAALPVLLEEVMEHLRLDPLDEAEQALISGYIAAAVSHVETTLNRYLLNTVVETTLPCFPVRAIELRGRVQSVTSITYLDLEGVEQTVDPDAYRVNTASEPGRVYQKVGYFWPTTLDQEDAVTVRYTSGYGATPETIPQGIKQAVFLLVSLWYEQRLPVVLGTSVSALPFSVECLLAPHKVWSL